MGAEGVLVLGAGLAGLGCARALPGARVFEAQAHPGGHAWSHACDGAWFDEGAHISHSSDGEFVGMITRGLEVHEIAASRVRNHWHGAWITYPVQNHLHELPPEARTRALADFVEAQAQGAVTPADYGQWCLAQYGRYLTEQFYREYTDKYWRVPMEALATDWLGGRLIPAQRARIVAGAFAALPEEQSAFHRFRYPRAGGFFRFFEPLYRGLDLTLGERAIAVDPRRGMVSFASGRTESYEALASSIPVTELVSMLRAVPADVAAAAAALRHTKLLCVNLVLRIPAPTDLHWFYVYDREIDAARVSVPSNLAPAMLPEGRSALQAEVFRRGDEPWDPPALAARTVDQLARLLGFTAVDVASVHPVVVPHAYPISDRHRARAAETVITWLERQRIYPLGIYGRWKYLWSDAAYRQGEETARRILAEVAA